MRIGPFSSVLFGVNPADLSQEAQCAQPPPSAVAPDGWGASTQNNQGTAVRGMPYTGPHLRPDVNIFTIEASMWW
jgi:hypothetical protein